MKHLIVLFTLAWALSPSSLYAQARDVKAQSVVLDDNNGHTLSVTTPAGMVSSAIYPLPIVPPGGWLPQSGGTMTGAISGLQAGSALGSSNPATGGYYTDNAIVASGVLQLGSVASQVGSYTMTHPIPGRYVFTFSNVSLTVSPDPFIVTGNTCCDGVNPVIMEVNWSSLSPLTWNVYVIEWNAGSWTFADHDFGFVLLGGGH